MKLKFCHPRKTERKKERNNINTFSGLPKIPNEVKIAFIIAQKEIM